MLLVYFFALTCGCIFFCQEYMPLPPSEEEDKPTDEGSEPKLQFSYVECLIFTFHQQEPAKEASKRPNVNH